MKILVIHYRYFISGGPERYLFNIKKSLEEKGHIIIPFSIKNTNNIKDKFESYFVRNIGNSNEIFVHKYPKNLKTYIDLVNREFYSFQVKRKLEHLIKKEKPDVCYLLVYKRALSPSVIDACKKYGIPIINRISDYNPVCGAGSLYRNGEFCDLCLKNEINCVKNKCIKGSTVFSIMRYMSIKLHKFLHMKDKVTKFICTNEYMAEIMKKYGYSANKLVVLPTFFKEDEDIKLWNKQNIVDPLKIKFLFIGNIDETKGIYDLLNAIKMLKNKTTNFHLYIVGGLHIEENKKVMDIIINDELSEYITLIPFIKSKEVYEYYLKTNVSILPARWVENLPNTLIESIYFNRPVVVPNFGSFCYTTDESVSFRYEALSSNALYKQLMNICQSPEIVKEKSKNCKKYFEEHYSEDMHIKKLIELLEENVKK